MSLWDQLLQVAKARTPELPKISPDLWGRTLEAHIRLDQQLVQLGRQEEVAKGLAAEVERVTAHLHALERTVAGLQAQLDGVHLQMEVLQAHDSRRRNG